MDPYLSARAEGKADGSTSGHNVTTHVCGRRGSGETCQNWELAGYPDCETVTLFACAAALRIKMAPWLLISSGVSIGIG